MDHYMQAVNFIFAVGQRVRIAYANGAGVPMRLCTNRVIGEIKAMTVDKRGRYVSVQFGDSRVLVHESQLVAA
jgi:hypothetical protein